MTGGLRSLAGGNTEPFTQRLLFPVCPWLLATDSLALKDSAVVCKPGSLKFNFSCSQTWPCRGNSSKQDQIGTKVMHFSC